MGQYRPQKRARVQEHHAVDRLGKLGCPADYEGPFRTNIRSFLLDFARGPQSSSPALSLPGIRSWSLPLRSEAGVELSLHILEECPIYPQSLHCDRCRVLGWSHHPVCQKRYHFIIGNPEVEESAGVGKGRKVCHGCSRVIPASTKTCPGCGSDATKGKLLEARTHLLHGVMHSNGYGHLLRVNGREGGSQSLSGRKIMDLWDRLCSMLRARKVSVMDVSKKHTVEFRLLHSVAYGCSWYGLWGYTFGRGCFCITDNIYSQAIDIISSTRLSSIVSCDKNLKRIVLVYQKLSTAALATVRDLIRFVMELLQKLGRESVADKGKLGTVERPVNPNHTAIDVSTCRWSAKRLEQAQDAFLKILRSSSKSVWLSRQALREAARSDIGDTGLLDFVLKGFVEKVVGEEIICRRINSRTRMLEYRLQKLICESKTDCDVNENHSAVALSDQPKYEEVLQDLICVYHFILETQGSSMLPNPSQVVLDVKQFIKDYLGELTREQNECDLVKSGWQNEDPFRVSCRVGIQDEDDEEHIPPELVVLPRDATVGDLKQNVTKAFRDVYMCFDRFKIATVREIDGVGDDYLLAAYFRESRFAITVEGTGVDEASPSRYERGTDQWVVDCTCGTKDDDGERMASCDSCGVWHHTRCAGISDADSVPQDGFVCKRCV